MTFCRWQTATSAQICVTTTVHTNALSANRYVPEVEPSELSSIILETIASLNDIQPLTDRLIQITRMARSPMMRSKICIDQ